MYLPNVAHPLGSQLDYGTSSHEIISSDQSCAVGRYRDAANCRVLIWHLKSVSTEDCRAAWALTSSCVQVFSPRSQILTLPAWSQLINSP